jgi:hypothetical protein
MRQMNIPNGQKSFMGGVIRRGVLYLWVVWLGKECLRGEVVGFESPDACAMRALASFGRASSAASGAIFCQTG